MEIPCYVVHIDLLMEVFTTRNQVKNIPRNLDTSKSTGVDGISAGILKECAEELSYPLTFLFNSSFKSRNVPPPWKRANVTPV